MDTIKEKSEKRIEHERIISKAVVALLDKFGYEIGSMILEKEGVIDLLLLGNPQAVCNLSIEGIEAISELTKEEAETFMKITKIKMLRKQADELEASMKL